MTYTPTPGNPPDHLPLLLLLLLQDAGTKSDFFLDVQAFKEMKE
jgi:hypothetical protein